MYKHDPLQFTRSDRRVYPAVFKSTNRDKWLFLSLIALFVLASLIK